MKKFIVAAFGSHGDILPCLDVARQCKSNGHEVVVVLNPYFQYIAQKSGVNFVTVGNENDILAVFNNPDSCDNRFFMRAIGASMHKFILDAAPIISAQTVQGNTILLGSSIVVGLKSIAQDLGIPVGLIHFTPKHLSSVHGIKNFAQARHPTADHLLKVVSDVSNRASVDDHVPLGDLADADSARLETYDQADLIIGAFPEWYAGTVGDAAPNMVLTDFPLHDDFAHASLSSEVEGFLSAGAPPVGFTPGTANALAQDFFARSVEACTISGRRAILMSMHSEHVPVNLPDHVLHVRYAPFKTLLPRLAVIVHHGGIGTASQALRAGVPQLIQPLIYDQFDTAERLTHLGVGLKINSEDYQPSRIIEMLDILEHSIGVRSSCDSLSMQMSNLGATQIYQAVVQRFAREAVLP